MLRDVAGGQRFTVMSRGRAVARILPVERKEQRDSIRRLLKLVKRLPVRHSGEWSRPDLYE
jgi:antitoxin (DNA-binding transcriptional repressor) of toxin-antitoxin stability system